MLLIRILLVCALSSVASPVLTSCLGSGDAEIEALAKYIGRQPHQALQSIELALNPDNHLTVERRAWLEAARAQAKRMLGREKNELPLAIDKAKALPKRHPALLHLQVASLYGAGLSQATLDTIYQLEDQVKQMPPKLPATLCLKIRLASVMADHTYLNGESFALASDAYHHADSEELAWMRAEAASVLGQVALRTDSSYARKLSEEALNYFKSEDMHDMAANELFMDGLSWAAEQDTDSLHKASQQFLRSMTEGQKAANPLAVAYAEAGLCNVLGQLGRVQDALKRCSNSLEQLKGIGHVTEYSTIINYAEALFLDSRPQEAMNLLVPLPENWPDGAFGFHGYRFYYVRGQINAALGNKEEAITDLNSALRELRGHESSARARTNRLMQSRFRVDQLARSLELKTLESEEREQRHLLLLSAGLIVLVLLCVIVITLVKHRRLYRRMAFTDPLTGVANRRYTTVRAQEAFAHARARKQPLYIVLLDLDRFKSLNDQFGHDAGDEALQQFARVAETVLRPGDVFGRWGGEEFLLVLQNIDHHGITAVLGRLRSAAANVRLTLAPEYPLQFSAGAVKLQENMKELEEMLKQADKALYQAKAGGRNQDCFAEAFAQGTN
ncbi:diguanylate cyclase domain-containing protein [Bowmanella yangjiangensis]|uniref:diguanylate cyclase n=1 Tax=Bowmanella yangjiangensis TaxID=2811230 RepID=A0ABS3CN76_9ALTE|nr:diguanylate cyclase [Bowmanella yangjiangensis]MBN7818507.1 diguanylate cyclase [Bowmanella yangjiangensis]